MSVLTLNRKCAARKTETYVLAVQSRKVTGKEASGRGRVAGVVEVSLDDAMVPGHEVELEDIADGSLGLVGTEHQASLAGLDLDGGGTSVQRQARGQENLDSRRHHFISGQLSPIAFLAEQISKTVVPERVRAGLHRIS